MQIQWYPGHMAKARRLLAESLRLVDVVVELADARAPLASQNPDFDDLFQDKPRVYLLNKADLADEETTRRWTAYFRKRGFAAIPFSASTGKGQAQAVRAIEQAAKPWWKGTFKRASRRPSGPWWSASPTWASPASSTA